MNYDPNPPPVEDTDPELAEQMKQISEGNHPLIKSVVVEKNCVRLYMKDGTVKTKRVKLPGRNEPCYCGSKKKFKRCCGR
jgi:uncharacterized protein YchJ